MSISMEIITKRPSHIDKLAKIVHNIYIVNEIFDGLVAIGNNQKQIS